MMSNNRTLNNMDYFVPFEVLSQGEGPCTFVFNVQKVKEVLQLSELSMLPPVYHPFVGLYQLRGVPVPVLSLEFILSDGKWTKDEAIQASRKDWTGHKVIILDLQGYYIGILAGHVGRIIDPKSIKYLPSPENMGLSQKGYINGMLLQQEKLYYLLDVEAILAELQGGVIEKTRIDRSQVRSYKGLRVLVAEDSALFRKKAEELFHSFGFDVTLATDGEKALEIVKSNPSQFDLIFTDIEMPIRNGISFIREIKKLDGARDIPVVFNTSLSNEGLVRDIEQEKLGDYIVKYDEKKIFEVLEKVFNPSDAIKGQVA